MAQETPMPVRLPPGWKPLLEAKAKSLGVSRNALAVRSIGRTLGLKPPGEEPVAGEATRCAHPKEKRNVLGYATFCDRNKGGCGVRMR